MAAPRAVTPAPAASSPGPAARGSNAISAMQYQLPLCLRDCHISVCLSQEDSSQCFADVLVHAMLHAMCHTCVVAVFNSASSS